MKSDSAIALGSEDDGTENYQINLNANKWVNENLKFKSTFYGRDTQSDYDKNSSTEENVTSIIKCMLYKQDLKNLTTIPLII